MILVRMPIPRMLEQKGRQQAQLGVLAKQGQAQLEVLAKRGLPQQEQLQQQEPLQRQRSHPVRPAAGQPSPRHLRPPISRR